jgi:RNA polymerase sigma-70 factor (ECF subfamily)
MPDPSSRRSVKARFDSTRWSIVLAAGVRSSPDAAVALETLCGSYWYPIYAFVRREGYQRAEAQDLTQGFFGMLLEREDLRAVHPDKGRFRSFLLAALKHFLINEWQKARAQKRGGGKTVLSLDFDSAETKFEMQPADPATPESVFNRQWALTLLASVQAALQREMAADDRLELYESLKPHLTGDPEAGKYVDVADGLGMTQAAVKMAMSRLRQRYRELLREEISQTVSSDEVDDEIRELFDALRRPGGGDC